MPDVLFAVDHVWLSTSSAVLHDWRTARVSRRNRVCNRSSRTRLGVHSAAESRSKGWERGTATGFKFHFQNTLVENPPPTGASNLTQTKTNLLWPLTSDLRPALIRNQSPPRTALLLTWGDRPQRCHGCENDCVCGQWDSTKRARQSLIVCAGESLETMIPPKIKEGITQRNQV